ncbi:poly-beta-1,6-N-acetyl-D-glucosamine biosynthesis protein PgaD [Acinetobacter sp. 194]|uniref:poly-beta-1,6-N-acetyl-D-glucosamine biosynthesis protein PgaD n=1 Tax=Acinetobacter shaoyimingii TaxID=2715164 RepID=UPI00140C41BF|nr:poly-beta-1,6-N-acetyl-D-glucosamine biosynthesis protein PgaD [Acinetobacter shaoyimingii]NHB57152.1 poly-beta-1,6-N-acetyl-D-glucosamine biosynthesis protein PgaD [Acinetobacter shaoyimingii]
MNNSDKVDIISDVSKLDIPKFIDQPKLVKNKSKFYVLQLLGWSFWTFLFIPLFTLMLWIFQGNLIKSYIFAEKLNVQLMNIAWLGALIVLFGTTLLLWASYNWIRFANVNNQDEVKDVDNHVLSKYLSVSSQELDTMQHSKNIVLHYDESGHLFDYELKQKIS